LLRSARIHNQCKANNETNRQTDIWTTNQTDREIDGWADRQTDLQIKRQTDIHIERQTDIHIERQTCRQTLRQLDRCTEEDLKGQPYRLTNTIPFLIISVNFDYTGVRVAVSSIKTIGLYVYERLSSNLAD